MLSTAATIKVSVVYLQSSLPCRLAGTYSFRKYLPSSFLHKLTSIYRQNWSCEKIPKSQKSDKATSFSSVVVNIASSVQKVSYSKPLHNKSRCLNTMKSFLAFKVITTWIFVYFQKGFTMKLWQNTQFTTAILFCFLLYTYWEILTKKLCRKVSYAN